MRIAPAGSVPASAASPGPRAVWGLAFGVVGVAAVLIATRVAAPSLGLAFGVAAGIGVTVWMFSSERMEGPLVVLLLYLGLLDGFLKLRTNSTAITSVRDLLLYAIVLGFLARAALRRQPLRFPPLSGWVLAFAVVVLAQVFNPGNHGVLNTLGGLRPQLEFVPLFFIGYAVLKTRARLQTFFVIMLVIATANGIVGMIQLNLSPAQLASWGPGYAARIHGGGTGLNAVSSRGFNTSTGATRTRPFGLGDDSGVGAAWGMLALGGALALMSLGTRRSVGRFSLLLCVGPPLAVISGEGRSLVVGAVVALVAYVAFATTARRLIPTLATVLLALAVVVGVVAYISSVSGAGVFDRYSTIAPSKLASTTSQSRGISFAAIPNLFVHEPLGGGLASVGPALGFAGGAYASGNGETEPGLLLSDLGIPGLLVVYGFMLHLLFLGVTRVKRLDPDTRIFVSALLAGIVGLLILGISGATTATAPDSAYLWFTGGALAYWLTIGWRPSATAATVSALAPSGALAPTTREASAPATDSPQIDVPPPAATVAKKAHRRVLVITPDFPPATGGIQIFSQRIAASFSDLEPTIVTLGHPDASAFDEKQAMQIVRSRTTQSRAITMAGLNATALAVALRERPDLVVSAHIVASPGAAMIRRRLGIPFVQYVYAKEIGAKPKLAHFAVTHADRVVAISRYASDLATEAGVHANRIAVINPGVDLPPVVPSRGDPSRPPTILTISRLDDAYKGHDVLLRALPLVRATIPSTRWHVVGDGSLRRGLEADANAMGLGDAVEFLGAVDDEARDRELAKADVFCMVSRLPGGGLAGEGFGIVYLEAGAHGLPVVAGAVGGATDAVVPGETGLLVNPADHVAVAGALIRLLSDRDLAGRLSRGGRAHAERNTWEAAGRRVEAELLSLLK